VHWNRHGTVDRNIRRHRSRGLAERRLNEGTFFYTLNARWANDQCRGAGQEARMLRVLI